MDVSTYKLLENRLNSFETWKHRQHIDTKVVAAAGFFFEESEHNSNCDHLRCAFCRVVVGNWSPGDDPWMVHMKARPRCIHVMVNWGRENIRRILLQLKEDYTVDRSSCPYSGEFAQRSESFYIPELYGNKGPLLFDRQSCQRDVFTAPSVVYTSPRGKRFMDPCTPRLSCIDQRRNTLDAVPSGLKRSLPYLDQVAESGLYYDDRNSVFRCYYCGVTVTSPGYDPWVLHAQKSECFHVILAKGEAKHDLMRQPVPAGPITRGQAKKLREVYTQRKELNCYEQTCSRCGVKEKMLGSLDQLEDQFECHTCVNNGPIPIC